MKPATVSGVIDVLTVANSILAAAGAATQTTALTKLVEALQVHADRSVASLADALATKTTRPRSRPSAKVPDETVVNSFVGRLKLADDGGAIKAVIATMKSSKLDKAHVVQIASRFSGDEPSYRKLSDAYARLMSAFVEQQRFRNKLSG